MIRKEYIFLSLPVIVSVVIKPSIVPTLLYVSLLHSKDSPLSNNRLARNVVVLLQIISDIIIPLHRAAPTAKSLLLKIYTFERIIISAVLNPDSFRLRSWLFYSSSLFNSFNFWSIAVVSISSE